MSKVKITGNASGTGTLTIAAPNTNTDRTLTLPDGAGEILTDAGVPASAMPSGTIIQTVVKEWDQYTSVAGGSSFTGGLFAQNITVQEGSKIVVLGNVARYTNATSSAWGQAFELSVWLGNYGGTKIADQEHVGNNQNIAVSFQTPIHAQTDALTAGTYTITVGGRTVANTNLHEFNRATRSSWMILHEVKA